MPCQDVFSLEKNQSIVCCSLKKQKNVSSAAFMTGVLMVE